MLGSIFVVLSVAGGLLGLSAGGGFGRNQFLVALAGSALITASLLGRRLPSVWRGFGLLLANLAAFAFAVELLSLLAIKAWNPEGLLMRARKERIANLSERDVSVVPGHYRSYLVWRADPLLPGRESTDRFGNRTTPGGESADSTAFQVFTFGGSAMWGSGVPDSCTVAAELQKILPDILGRPVRVTNYGQLSWVSTQELICLLLELREGRIPDLVVFYDGFNDIWSSYAAGRAGEHHDFSMIESRVEGTAILAWQANLAGEVFNRTNAGQLVHLIRTSGTLAEPDHPETSYYITMGLDAEELAESTFALYTRNLGCIQSLGEAYGFDCLFFWQPVIWCGNKPLTASEDSIRRGGDECFQAAGNPAWSQLLISTQRLAEGWPDSSLRVIDLTHLFDTTEAEIYCDAFGCHLNPTGNRMVAEAMAGEIIEACGNSTGERSAEQ